MVIKLDSKGGSCINWNNWDLKRESSIIYVFIKFNRLLLNGRNYV